MGRVPHYVVAGPTEYLAITGWRIPDIKIAKKALILPGQRYERFIVSPLNYTFEIQAMSADKLPFLLPAVFTIGPNVNDKASLVLYAKKVINSNHLNDLVRGIIEDEIRALAASKTMEKIFKHTKQFIMMVFYKAHMKLNQFGLVVFNINFKQFVDARGPLLDYVD